MHFNNSSANSLSSSSAEPSIDDTSSSYSSNSRSQTPTSLETSSQMEYMSSSPFTDSEQEVPRTFSSSAENYPVPCSSLDNYHQSAYAADQTSMRPGSYRDGAMNGPLNLAKSAAASQRDSQSYSQQGSGSSKSQLGFFNCKIESDSMWRPW